MPESETQTAPPQNAVGAKNPFVFLVGCARSGTTLLRRIIGAHPLIAVPPETHWLPRFCRKRWKVDDAVVVTPKLLDALVEYRHFQRMKISRETLEGFLSNGHAVSYAEFVDKLFTHFAGLQGKPLAADKTPGYERRIPILHSLWPEAKFIHLIRDGRDVCLSMLNWKGAPRSAGRFACWADDPVCTTALWWKWHVLLGRQYGRALPPSLYTELHYEALVKESSEKTRAFCEFLGIDYDERMVNFHEGRVKDNPALDAKDAWRPITSGLRDWRTQMSPGDVEKFEACAGDALEEFGYERPRVSVPPQTAELAKRVRDAFTEDVQGRGHALPDQW